MKSEGVQSATPTHTHTHTYTSGHRHLGPPSHTTPESVSHTNHLQEGTLTEAATLGNTMGGWRDGGEGGVRDGELLCC